MWKTVFTNIWSDMVCLNRPYWLTYCQSFTWSIFEYFVASIQSLLNIQNYLSSCTWQHAWPKIIDTVWKNRVWFLITLEVFLFLFCIWLLPWFSFSYVFEGSYGRFYSSKTLWRFEKARIFIRKNNRFW